MWGPGEALPELDNIWAAWRWAIRRRSVTAIAKFVGSRLAGLYQLYHSFGRIHEGEELFDRAVVALRAGERTREKDIALGIALRDQGFLASSVGHRDKALRSIRESISILRQRGAWEEFALSKTMAAASGLAGDDAAARQLLQESLAVSRETGFQFGQSWALGLLGSIALRHGAYGEAERQFRAS